jgi:exopolyphosphatase/pppGpp-phosphohydrolase
MEIVLGRDATGDLDSAARRPPRPGAAKLQWVSRSRSRQIVAGALVARAGMKALNVDSVDVCPWALREGIILHYLQTTFNQSFDLPLRPLTGSNYGNAASGSPGGRHVAMVATSSSQA